MSPFEPRARNHALSNGPVVVSRGGRPKAPPAPLPVAEDGWSTCPTCGRTWLVVAVDDVLLPGCGHLGTDWTQANRYRPCVPCGLKHEQDCDACSLLAVDSDEFPQWQAGAEHITGGGKHE